MKCGILQLETNQKFTKLQEGSLFARMSQNEFKRMAQNSGAVFRGVTLFLYSLHSYYVIIHDTTGDWLWCCVFCILDVLLKGQGGDCCKDFAAWMNID
jgi:hypothetical protein